ncbi:MAG: hypothetical protein NWE89_01905 [Candidatus Bathyarchaeota archaeon]|nr:hypothetical protein [Candidatus Bathyarchaeota archaeon]
MNKGGFRVFSVMAVNPNHVALSVPSEMMPQMTNTLENWVKRGKVLFNEKAFQFRWMVS